MSSATPIYHAGYGGTAAVGGTDTSGTISGGTELPITDWEVNPKVEAAHFRTSKNGPYEQLEANWQTAQVTISIEYDFANNPFQISGNALKVGATVSNVQLFLHQSGTSTLDGLFWYFPSLIVMDVHQVLPVDGKNITTKVMCNSNGKCN